MYLADRWIQHLWEKVGWFGVIGVVGAIIILLIIGVLIGASLNSRYEKKNLENSQKNSKNGYNTQE